MSIGIFTGVARRRWPVGMACALALLAAVPAGAETKGIWVLRDPRDRQVGSGDIVVIHPDRFTECNYNCEVRGPDAWGTRPFADQMYRDDDYAPIPLPRNRHLYDRDRTETGWRHRSREDWSTAPRPDRDDLNQSALDAAATTILLRALDKVLNPGN